MFQHKKLAKKRKKSFEHFHLFEKSVNFKEMFMTYTAEYEPSGLKSKH